jgi:beta-xylosidase
MTWGPAVHRTGREWVLYYSTQVAASKLECIGRAVSNRPTGPFIDRSPAPMVCPASLGGAIDPSVVTDARGASSLLWKNDGNAVGAPVGIWQQPLAPDGLSVVGSPTRLVTADQAWEHGIVEGPAMLAATKGGWWLFYSGGTWQSNTYDTGVAWCARVSGPCQKPADAPLLASTPTAVSPGGFDTFVDANGKRWASYSAFPDRPANAEAAMAENRVLELAPVLSH